MSGHSKWHQIKHKKAQTDSQKSRLFGRLARDIQIAARAGEDPALNAALREAIARAKKANMPQENIERLLRNVDGAALTEMMYEAFGPQGVALLILTMTDNPNRTVAELRTILKKHGGVLGTAGSVRWKFTSRTVLTAALPVAPTDTLLEQCIDAGAEDISVEGTMIKLSAAPAATAALHTILTETNATNIAVATTLHVLPAHQHAVTTELRVAIAALERELTHHSDVQQVATDIAV